MVFMGFINQHTSLGGTILSTDSQLSKSPEHWYRQQSQHLRGWRSQGTKRCSGGQCPKAHPTIFNIAMK